MPTPEEMLKATAANLKASRDVQLSALALHDQCEKALSDADAMVRSAQAVIAELLAALKEVVESCLGGSRPGAPVLERARAIIAKTEGSA